MSSYVTPKKNTAFVMYLSLTSQADTKLFQSNPTLATGDVKVSIDGAALGNITTLPDVDPDNSKLVKLALSASEMNGDNIQVLFSDAAGAEWCDCMINIQTSARQIDDLAFPVVSGRGFDVTATGGVGIDWANVENPTSANNLSGTNIKTDQVVASVSGAVGSVTGAVGSVTGLTAANLDATVSSRATPAQVNSEVVDGLAVDVIADSVPADGSRPTIAQALYMLIQFLTERAVSGTTMTVKKPDGTTALMTFTLNDAVNPTSISRAT